MVKRCPLSNKRFNDDLDKWALSGRTPGFNSFSPSIGDGYNWEIAALSKCRISRLFDDDDLVLDWMNTGNMSKAVCAELIKGERKYRDMVFKEKYGQ